MDQLVDQLKALAEPTRLRIVVALESCELSVSEICTVLDQAQPRVSRHLRLLAESGIVHRHAEGANAYFGLRRPTYAGTAASVLTPLVDRSSPVLVRDQHRLEQVRARRAERAAEYFADVAARWDELRELHAPTAEVESAMLSAVEPDRIDTLLDIGTGTGRILELFADRITHGVGIDVSRQMLSVARARLDDDQLAHCSVRHQDVYNLDIDDGTQQAVVLHHVLHYLSDPSSALAVAERVLRPGGTLVVVDFAEHRLEALREQAHSHLGFADADVTRWCGALGLETSTPRHFFPASGPGDDVLTVTMWRATKPASPTAPAPGIDRGVFS